jgi:hypothetical protein
MKTSYWITFGICLLALIIIGGNWLGILPNFRVGTPQTILYQDSYNEFVFGYTEDLIARDISYPNESIRILNIMPRATKGKFDPQFIEIISYDSPKKTLEDAVIDFLPGVNRNSLNSLERDGMQVVEYSQIKGVGEESLYTFFNNGERIAIVIFRMRGFDRANPLVLIDNSRYLSSYKQIASTFNFN